jgi:hypothetical protein
MTRQEFVREIIARYHKARQSLYPHERVFRGGSRSISSETEDLFARYLIDKLSPDNVIYINQTITPLDSDLLKCIKPDLVIINGGFITAILDLKMDLGYKRNEFADFWRERDEWIQLMRNQKASLLIDTGGGSKRQELVFSPDARLFFVLVSDRNISKKKFIVIRQMQEIMKFSDLVILTQGEHPNVYGLTIDGALQRIIINEHDFNYLEQSLKQH